MKIDEQLLISVFEVLIGESKDKRVGRLDRDKAENPGRVGPGQIHTLIPHSWKHRDGSDFKKGRTKISKINSLNDLKRWAQDVGLNVTLSGRGHWEIRDPFTDRKLATLASTGSDVRAHLNSRAELRRSLRDVGWPHDLPPE